NPNPQPSYPTNEVGPSIPNHSTSPPEGYVPRAQFEALQTQVQSLMAIISSRPNLAQSTEPESQTPNRSQHPEQVAESAPNSAHLDELVDKKIREAMMRPPSQPTPSSTSPAITCPLSDHILEAPLPSHFRMPHIEAYDGSSDPLDHLHTFQDLMLLQGAPDPILCRAFPATFRKAARV